MAEEWVKPFPHGAAIYGWDAEDQKWLPIPLNRLIPESYDYIELGYTGSDLTTVIYKRGGAAGTIVATLTLGYTGSDLTSVTKS
jgi:hypothetical protein